MNTYPIVTAHEALADGIHPGELFRAARLNSREGKPQMAAAIRRVAFDLANLMGMRVRHHAASNDNRRQRERGKGRAT